LPLDITTFTLVDRPVTFQEGLKILERDGYRCRYCGLDGKASFENALLMTVDFVVPRARKGKKDPANLVACCWPCNAIKAKAGIAASRTPRLTSWRSARNCAKRGEGGLQRLRRTPRVSRAGSQRGWYRHGAASSSSAAFYSHRKAMTGSTRKARRAGM
jgi:HNH endonuclease